MLFAWGAIKPKDDQVGARQPRLAVPVISAKGSHGAEIIGPLRQKTNVTGNANSLEMLSEVVCL